MMNTRDKVYDAAENVKPYVERAMTDEQLRADVLSAFNAAKELYARIDGSRSAVSAATRVATDDDLQDKLRVRSRTCGARLIGSRASASTATATRRCSSPASRSAFSSTRSPAPRPASG